MYTLTPQNIVGTQLFQNLILFVSVNDIIETLVEDAISELEIVSFLLNFNVVEQGERADWKLGKGTFSLKYFNWFNNKYQSTMVKREN